MRVNAAVWFAILIARCAALVGSNCTDSSSRLISYDFQDASWCEGGNSVFDGSSALVLVQYSIEGEECHETLTVFCESSISLPCSWTAHSPLRKFFPRTLFPICQMVVQNVSKLELEGFPQLPVVDPLTIHQFLQQNLYVTSWEPDADADDDTQLTFGPGSLWLEKSECHAVSDWGWIVGGCALLFLVVVVVVLSARRLVDQILLDMYTFSLCVCSLVLCGLFICIRFGFYLDYDTAVYQVANISMTDPSNNNMTFRLFPNSPPQCSNYSLPLSRESCVFDASFSNFDPFDPQTKCGVPTSCNLTHTLQKKFGSHLFLNEELNCVYSSPKCGSQQREAHVVASEANRTNLAISTLHFDSPECHSAQTTWLLFLLVCPLWPIGTLLWISRRSHGVELLKAAVPVEAKKPAISPKNAMTVKFFMWCVVLVSSAFIVHRVRGPAAAVVGTVLIFHTPLIVVVVQRMLRPIASKHWQYLRENITYSPRIHLTYQSLPSYSTLLLLALTAVGIAVANNLHVSDDDIVVFFLFVVNMSTVLFGFDIFSQQRLVGFAWHERYGNAHRLNPTVHAIDASTGEVVEVDIEKIRSHGVAITYRWRAKKPSSVVPEQPHPEDGPEQESTKNLGHLSEATVLKLRQRALRQGLKYLFVDYKCCKGKQIFVENNQWYSLAKEHWIISNNNLATFRLLQFLEVILVAVAFAQFVFSFVDSLLCVFATDFAPQHQDQPPLNTFTYFDTSLGGTTVMLAMLLLLVWHKSASLALRRMLLRSLSRRAWIAFEMLARYQGRQGRQGRSCSVLLDKNLWHVGSVTYVSGDTIPLAEWTCSWINPSFWKRLFHFDLEIDPERLFVDQKLEATKKTDLWLLFEPDGIEEMRGTIFELTNSFLFEQRRCTCFVDPNATSLLAQSEDRKTFTWESLFVPGVQCSDDDELQLRFCGDAPKYVVVPQNTTTDNSRPSFLQLRARCTWRCVFRARWWLSANKHPLKRVTLTEALQYSGLECSGFEDQSRCPRRRSQLWLPLVFIALVGIACLVYFVMVPAFYHY